MPPCIGMISPPVVRLPHLIDVSQTSNLAVSGRLLNRFGKDIDAIDSTLSNTMFTVGTSLASFVVAVLTIACVYSGFEYDNQLTAFGSQCIFPCVLDTCNFHRHFISHGRKALPKH